MKVIWVALAVVLLLALVGEVFLPRPIMYIDQRGECLYLVVENPKNGIPMRMTCEDATWNDKIFSEKKRATEK